MYTKLIISVFYFCYLTNLIAQKQVSLVDSLLHSNLKITSVIAQPKKYKIQLIYTQINRDANNIPSFKTFNYLVDSSNYFYCASLVKLPCSILALEKINELKKTGITKDSYFFTDSITSCQHPVKRDTTSESGYPSIAHYLKKMLLVSDNVAYGRVYEFLSPDYIHKRLSYLGWKNTFITHRFDGGCSGQNNLITNPVSFYNKDLNELYRQEAIFPKLSFKHPLGEVKVGKAYFNSKNKKINEPKDFSSLNYLSLQTINEQLKRLVFNNYFDKKQKFNLTHNDWQFLMSNLSKYPRESKFPSYPSKGYHDSYKKYFLYGDSKKPITNDNIRIFNIVGQSYGFMVDCAYIVDFKNSIEFMLSAVIYTNEDEIINDGKYEYTTIALPYLAEVGKLFYNYELKRKKAILPDLKYLKAAIDYKE